MGVVVGGVVFVVVVVAEFLYWCCSCRYCSSRRHCFFVVVVVVGIRAVSSASGSFRIRSRSQEPVSSRPADFIFLLGQRLLMDRRRGSPRFGVYECRRCWRCQRKYTSRSIRVSPPGAAPR